MILFKDRQDAGERLGERLKACAVSHPLVVGLARGGVVTARALAGKLGASWNLICIKKIGAPWQPELALGAVSETGEHVLNEDLIEMLHIEPEELTNRITLAASEASEKAMRLRDKRPLPNVENRTVILADDGLATGATMRSAILSMRKKRALKVIVAVPVAASDSLEKVEEEADDTICLEIPLFFQAVGEFYENFKQVEDEEVIHYAKELGS